MLAINKSDLAFRHEPASFSDRVAKALAKALRRIAGLLGKRYRHRAAVLETVTAVPGMVAAMVLHLKCLRRGEDDGGWIRTLMEEAEAQRAHLMVFVQIDRPNRLERLVVLLTQGVFYNAFFLLCLISPATAHRLSAYMAEDAIEAYGGFLAEIEAGRREAVPAPPMARDYWDLEPDARLRDVLRLIRQDEAIHRDINHLLADALGAGERLPGRRLPVV